jgi:hypothetical protein
VNEYLREVFVVIPLAFLRRRVNHNLSTLVPQFIIKISTSIY